MSLSEVNMAKVEHTKKVLAVFAEVAAPPTSIERAMALYDQMLDFMDRCPDEEDWEKRVDLRPVFDVGRMLREASEDLASRCEFRRRDGAKLHENAVGRARSLAEGKWYRRGGLGVFG